MAEPLEPDALLQEFRRERSVRRTVNILEAKRLEIRRDLQRLITHIALLLPASAQDKINNDLPTDLLEEAAKRLGDEAFTDLLLQLLNHSK